MSNVVKGARVPGHLRAIANLTLGCVLLGGCSAGSDRFASASFGTGYGAGPRTSQTAEASPRFASNQQAQAQNGPIHTQTQPVSYQPQASSGGYQLASANGAQSGGYMQASRVELPPLPQQPAQSQGVKVADGYGRGNLPPLADGQYTGPRIRGPFDPPMNELPPEGDYAPEGGGSAAYERRGQAAQPPASNFYQRSKTPYTQQDGARVYEPKREQGYAGGNSYSDERSAYNGAPDGGAEQRRPWSGRTDGEMVEVARGDTVYTLARRYGVTVDMIARANGLTSVYLRPGTKLFIPRADPASYAQSAQAQAQAPGKKGHTAATQGGKDESRLAAAQSGKISGNAGPAGEAPKAAAPANPKLVDKGHAQSVQKAPVAVPGQLVQPAPDVKTAGPISIGEASCEATLINPQPRMGATFRTPVDGKTIAQFGPQKDGTVNEGITISVPRGTQVKAAENGVVAYVGDELPGFGNLILIRHADEFVTAYAHADTVLVKKCDVVKRGQTVATAGSTGDASQPQVHFEIRKNSKPVDPSPLLGS
jgi:murein DD-endopeptidase MepM/ murein hydrolase activator NlpD